MAAESGRPGDTVPHTNKAKLTWATPGKCNTPASNTCPTNNAANTIPSSIMDKSPFTVVFPHLMAKAITEEPEAITSWLRQPARFVPAIWRFKAFMGQGEAVNWRWTLWTPPIIPPCNVDVKILIAHFATWWWVCKCPPKSMDCNVTSTFRCIYRLQMNFNEIHFSLLLFRQISCIEVSSRPSSSIFFSAVKEFFCMRKLFLPPRFCSFDVLS